jgi:hypothetical protein
MDIYDATVPVFESHLRAIEKWLDRVAADTNADRPDPELLMSASLAPDAWPLLRQVTGACDAAKWAAANSTSRRPTRSCATSVSPSASSTS